MINKSSRIKMLVMDVDGTLTDGKIYYGNHGEMFKAFDIHDGYQLSRCDEYGIITVIITGKTSDIVTGRANELKINEVYQGISNKLVILKQVLEKNKIDSSQVAYIGDDINDIECMCFCGLSACPVNAVAEVKNTVDYVCKCSGGQGAVREFIDIIINGKNILKNNNKITR